MGGVVLNVLLCLQPPPPPLALSEEHKHHEGGGKNEDTHDLVLVYLTENLSEVQTSVSSIDVKLDCLLMRE